MLAAASLTGWGHSRLGVAQGVGEPIGANLPSWDNELRQLAPAVYAYIQSGGPGINNASMSNAGVIVGPDDLLAVDALGPPIFVKDFRARATAATGKNFGRVVNTHYHRDHTNGNCFFLPAELVSHEVTRELVIVSGIPERPYPNRPEWRDGMDELVLAPPTTTITGDVTYRYGDLVVQLLVPGPAHTFGDVMVYLPQERILFTGDIAFFYVTPAAFASHPTRWLEAIERILAMDVEVIVPGHGPIGGKAELSLVKEYLELVIREARRRYDAGVTPGQAAADIDLGRFAGWPNEDRIVATTVRLYAEFDGTLTREIDRVRNDQAMQEYLAILASR